MPLKKESKLDFLLEQKLKYSCAIIKIGFVQKKDINRINKSIASVNFPIFHFDFPLLCRLPFDSKNKVNVIYFTDDDVFSSLATLCLEACEV